MCDVDRCRFYLCEDADDDIQTLDAKTCKDAVDAADESLQEAKEKRLKREKQLRKEERLRLEKDARAAAGRRGRRHGGRGAAVVLPTPLRY